VVVTGLATAWEEAKAQARAVASLSLEQTPAMSLRAFVEGAWHVNDPAAPFLANWHVDAICEHLEAIASGDMRRLVINVPPGHAKSLIVSVLWPAWMWHYRPQWASIFTSYDPQLTSRDAVRARDVLRSPWFQETFAPKWKFAGDQNVKSYFANSAKGFRYSTSIAGAATGWRGHAVVVDDPVNVKKANSAAAMDEVIRIWDTAMSSRLLDMQTGAHVIIMQRLNMRDLSGHVLAKEAGYQHLSLPSEFEPAKRSTTVTVSGVTWTDPRTEPGELLFPAKFPRAVLDQATLDLGGMQYAAQHQQAPVPAAGGVFKREWFRFYRKRELPPVWNEKLQSWDLTFKKSEGSDYVVGDVWGRLGANCYLLHHDRERRDFVESKKALLAMTKRFPEATLKLIEDKANGPAIIAELRNSVPGIVGVGDPGGVLAQAWATQPLVEARQIWLPDPSEAPWINDWLDEVCGYPKFGFDDRVAAATQAWQRFQVHIRGGMGEPIREDARPSEAAVVAGMRF
jgi:predicted phage terminase large subunit-like protein